MHADLGNKFLTVGNELNDLFPKRNQYCVFIAFYHVQSVFLCIVSLDPYTMLARENISLI